MKVLLSFGFVVMMFVTGLCLAKGLPVTSLGHRCIYGPHTGDSGRWTGRTKVVNSRMFYEQRCIQGHSWFTSTP